MIRPEYRAMLEGQHKILVILWAVFVVAIFLYLWIAHTFLASGRMLAGESFSRSVRLFLWLLAFVDLGTLMWWKRRFLTREAILGGLKQYKLLQALQGHKSPLEERAAGIVSSYVTSKVVAFAMVEAVAIYGFALAVIGRYPQGQYVLSAASGALLILEFPSRPFLEKLLQEIESKK